MANEYSKLLDSISEGGQQKISVPKALEVLRDQLTDISKNNKSLHISRLSMRLHFDLSEILEGDKSEAIKLSEKIDARKPLRLVKVITPREDEMASSYRLTHLQREADFIEKETGNYDVYIGYPFVEGAFGDGTHFKCPLLLYPAVIEKDYKKLEFTAKPDADRTPILNKTFIIAYQKFNRIKFNPEYDFEIEEGENGFLKNGIKKCEELGIKFTNKQILELGVTEYDPKGQKRSANSISLRNFAILGLFPQTSSTLLADYESLMKESPKEGALYSFFNGEAQDKSEWLKSNEHANKAYLVTDVDASQEKALLSLEKLGGIAIHGPPGTGKSQLIVNILADSVAKGKRTLLVCEKRAALDVVFNRMSSIGLGDMVALVHDYNKDRHSVFQKAAKNIDEFSLQDVLPEITVDDKGNRSEELLNQLVSYHSNLNLTLPCNTSLKNLYSVDEDPLALKTEYLNSLENDFTFQELSDGLEKISDMLQLVGKSGKGLKPQERDKFSSFNEEKLRAIEITLRKLFGILENLSDIQGFEQFASLHLDSNNLVYPKTVDLQSKLLSLPKKSKSLLKFADSDYRQASKFLETLKNSNHEQKLPTELIIREISGENLKLQTKTYSAILLLRKYNEFMKEFESLAKDLESQIGSPIASNLVLDASSSIETAHAFLDDMQSSLRNKEKAKIMQTQAEDLSKKETNLLAIARKLMDREKDQELALRILKHSFYSKWIDAAENTMPLVKKLDRAAYQRYRFELRSLLEKRKFKSRQEVKRNWQHMISSQKYSSLKEIKFQCEKTKNPWSMRKLVREFNDKGILDVFPVWLTSPETASAIFPLKAGLFDVVVFDEASQITLEHAVPSLYRSKSVAVAGDEKQLPPFDLFSSHLTSDDGGEDDSLSKQELNELLSVKSFLQLAKRRYPEVMLNWHYRSKYEELISFSNYAFYSGRIRTIANTQNDKKEPSIKWLKVDGKWDKRRNRIEAEKVVELISQTISKPNPPSIGVVTFNSSQKDLIENLLDKKALSDSKFYINYKRELEREENEEIQSLFVKNIENVQGDERDLIIFSIGYAPTVEDGKVVSQFGTLSIDGGENRLNVAITRAKEKIIVVSSIDPLQLRAPSEGSLGVSYLRKFLEYAKNISEGKNEDASAILRGFGKENFDKIAHDSSLLAESIGLIERLQKSGFDVKKNVGYSKGTFDLAIVDKNNPHKFSLGIEIDGVNYSGILDAKDRDVYSQNILEDRGWKTYRLSSRDWWADSDGVMREIKQELKSNG
ncbi:hypothetical protein HY989_00570 [Candidatus Micrarchaeota archaeon]|nr:hypothetical protein [Candidatus Micrarchaeota archaeon]